MVNNGLAIDYTFAFDASGTTAMDTLNLECGSGSGHAFALGWTLCDAINLFGSQGTVTHLDDEVVMSVRLWPNPADDTDLHVSGVPDQAGLIVRDMTGTLVWKGMADALESVVPTRGWTPGVYVLSWQAVGTAGHRRFIVR